MLITDYEDKMRLAIQHGAVQGFGKDSILSENPEESLNILRKYIK